MQVFANTFLKLTIQVQYKLLNFSLCYYYNRFPIKNQYLRKQILIHYDI